MHPAIANVTNHRAERFTLDGSALLEAHLAQVCERIRTAVLAIVPPPRLEGLVLAGGYGRGEGGVLQTNGSDEPYNDLEFYVFLKGRRLWNEAKYNQPLTELGAALSPEARVHVEFKVDSLERLRRSPVSMFSYDLASRHHVLHGNADLFKNCEHHLKPRDIPLAEATRLLFNRCTGLLLAKERLLRGEQDPEDADFINRNLAKAQLAMGDAVLAVFQRYHWSCRVRHARLAKLVPPESLPWLEAVQQHHSAGLQFKLHPFRGQPDPELASRHRDICALVARVWVWVEGRRLHSSFSTPEEYALSSLQKWPGTSAWQNCLLTLRTFGPSALFKPLASRYPRERLLNTLPLLLWGEEAAAPSDAIRHAQTQLHTSANDWRGLVSAYKSIWAGYG